MINETLHSILDPLYLAEAASLFRYLRTVHLYGGPVDTIWRRALADMLARNEEYTDRLADFCVRNQINPPPASFPKGFSGLHDNSLVFVVGRMIQDKRELVKTYSRALEQLEVAAESGTQGLTSFVRIALAAHQSDLDILENQPHLPTAKHA